MKEAMIGAKTRRELEAARKEIKEGKMHSFDKVKRELGLRVGHRKKVYDKIR